MLDDGRLQATVITRDDWILGPWEAPNTILEYADLECPYCAAAAPLLADLVEGNPGAIRLVYRHFPLTSIHPNALLAAEATEAAGAQGRFWELHDIIFANRERLEFGDLHRYANALRLDMDRFDRELRAGVHRAEVERDYHHGIQDSVRGTPTLFLNGHRYDGVRDHENILAALAAAQPPPEMRIGPTTARRTPGR